MHRAAGRHPQARLAGGVTQNDGVGHGRRWGRCVCPPRSKVGEGLTACGSLVRPDSAPVNQPKPVHWLALDDGLVSG